VCVRVCHTYIHTYIGERSVSARFFCDAGALWRFSRTSCLLVLLLLPPACSPHLHRLSLPCLRRQVVKLALALARFGGNQKNGTDKNKLAVRGDPYVLVVGEPGLHRSCHYSGWTMLA